MINDVVPVVWPQDHRDEVFAQKFFFLFVSFASPSLSLLSDLTHTYRDLGRMQFLDRRVLQHGFMNNAHHRPL